MFLKNVQQCSLAQGLWSEFVVLQAREQNLGRNVGSFEVPFAPVNENAGMSVFA